MAIVTHDVTQQIIEPDARDFEHTGPGALAGRYLRTFWHPVCLSDDLKRGWAVPLTVMSEKLTLYRGETGTAHLVAFRCAHRGTQLSTGWVEEDCIRCRYHGWKYDANGQCVDAPLEEPGFPARIRIRSYPVQEYLGLIFAYLGEGQPPPLPHYSAFDHEGIIETHTYTRGCNLFNQMENDPGHLPFTHRKPNLPRGQFDLSRHQPADMVVEERPWGITRYTRRGVQYLWPTALFSGDRSRPNLHFQVPITDELYASFQTELIPVTGEEAERRLAARAAWLAEGGKFADNEVAQQVLEGKIRLHDFDANPGEVVIARVQDDVTQIGQGRIRDKTHEHLGRSDAYVVMLRRVWERELRAFAAGAPLKEWHPTDDMWPLPVEDEGMLTFRHIDLSRNTRSDA